MAKQSRNTLKGYFETGDIPTGGNYVDLIDTPVILDSENTGSIDIQGSITSSGTISSSGDIYGVTGSFTGGINAVEASGSFNYITTPKAELTVMVGETLTAGTVNVDTIREKTTSNGVLFPMNITASANISASGFISAFGSSSFVGLPTTEPLITGALWLSGSGGGSASGSKYLMVFTG